jgi:hypothetical protein
MCRHNSAQPLNQRGFMPVFEIILIAGLIAVAGFVGYKTYTNRTARPPSANPPVSTTTPPPPASGTGVYGRITQGPTCPVARDNDPSCDDRPLQTELIVTTAGQTDVYPDRKPAPTARFSSDQNGYFRASLPEGEYIIELSTPPAIPGFVANNSFVVKPNTFTEINLYYNTRLR